MLTRSNDIKCIVKKDVATPRAIKVKVIIYIFFD